MRFNFTGTLRPWTQSPTRVVPEHIPRPDYADDGAWPHSSRVGSRKGRRGIAGRHSTVSSPPPPLPPLGYPTSEAQARNAAIKSLSDEEAEHMRVVCKLGREVLDECAKVIKVGVTADEIDRVCHAAAVARDCYPSPLNYHNFPKSCCTSVNEVICHGIPDERPLANGDIVNVDVTVYFNGYHGDLNETFYVGEVDDDTVRLVNTTYECIMTAIAACKPGVRYREIGNICSKIAHANKCSVVRSYCGHGIHSLFHTAPSVPHYASEYTRVRTHPRTPSEVSLARSAV